MHLRVLREVPLLAAPPDPIPAPPKVEPVPAERVEEKV